MSDQAFEVASADVGGGQNFDRVARNVSVETYRDDAGSAGRRAGVAAQTAESSLNVTDSVNSMRTSLMAGDLSAFGQQIQQLGGGNATQIRSVFQQLQPLFEGTGIQARIMDGQPPKLQLQRMVNEQGEQIVGQNGIRQRFTFTPGMMHPQVRMVRSGENGGAARSVPITEASGMFTGIGDRLRSRGR